jgi:hypothetical protein
MAAPMLCKPVFDPQLTENVAAFAVHPRQSHPATICSKSFMMSSRWYGSLGLGSNVKC